MKILLIGDWIQDVNLYGTCTRLCPEAPVPVWVPDGRRTSTPGGMGLVAANLVALGAEVTQYILSNSVKTRFWSGKHLILRQDEDSVSRAGMDYTILNRLKDFDAVVVSDYQKGGIDDDHAKAIAYHCNQTRVKLFVDTKNPHPGLYAHAYAIFPNDAEMPNVDPSQFQHVIHKMGAKGCQIIGDEFIPGFPGDEFIPGFPVEEFDVTGAGDVFLATFVVSNLESWCIADCAQFANRAASISVTHQGGYVLTPDDILEVNGGKHE